MDCFTRLAARPGTAGLEGAAPGACSAKPAASPA